MTVLDLMQASYDMLLKLAERGENDALTARVRYWRDGGWLVYFDFVVAHLPGSPEGKRVLDFGSGSGLLAPIVLALGATEYVGVDVLPDLADAQRLLERWSMLARLVEPEDGYIPLQPKSIDIAIANEVVSHVPKAQLPIVYDELWRVLAPGGVLFVSDGNGLDSASYFHKTLLPLYEALENGPDGVQVGGPPFPVTVGRCFLTQRKDLIRGWYPDLKEVTVDHIARNTAGLHTGFLRKTVDHCVATGVLIRRPYERGHVPVVPTTGVVEERGFFAQEVALDLRARGFAVSVHSAGARPRSGWYLERTLRTGVAYSTFPEGNFTVIATKPGESYAAT